MVDNRETETFIRTLLQKIILMHANFKGADQAAHQDSLIKAFFAENLRQKQ